MDSEAFVPIKQQPAWIVNNDNAPRGLVDFDDVIASPSVDLRSVINEVIRDTGHYVLLRRTNKNIHCFSCWNHISQGASDTCPYCGGTGRVSVIERHKARKDPVLRQMSRPDNIVLKQESNIAVPEYAFYFKYDVHPQVQDIIYEVSWLNNYSEPKSILTEYRIGHVTQYRKQRGRIEYHEAAGKARPVNRSVHSVQVRRLRNNITNSNSWYYLIDY